MGGELARRFEQLGIAASLWFEAHELSGRSVRDLLRAVWPAILHRQICFVVDREGYPIAYWTWAFLASDVERRVTHEPDFQLDDSEWNEGQALWVMDFVAPYGYVANIVRYIRSAMYPGVVRASSRRVRANGQVRITRWTQGRVADYEEYRRQGARYRLPRSAFAVSVAERLPEP